MSTKTQSKFSPEILEREGLTGTERERLKALERDVRELRQANEILHKVSAYFAQAEQDCPFKR